MIDLEEIGLEVPNNIKWKLLTLDQIKSQEKRAIISGPFGSNISSKFFTSTGVPVIRGNNLSNQIGIKFKDSGFVFISPEKANELNSWAIKEDLLFTAAGTIGQVGIITGNEKFTNYTISNKQLRVRLDRSIINPYFAYYWFASPAIVDIIIQRDTGSTIPLINLGVLKSLPILLPSLPEQDSIAEVLRSLDDKIDLLHRNNKTLEQLGETLFRQWFVENADDEGFTKLGDIIELFDNKRIPLSSTERAKKKSGILFPYYGAATIMDYINEYIFDGDYLLLGEDGTVQDENGFPILQRAIGKFWVNNHTHVIKGKLNYSNNYIEILLKHTNISHLVTGAVQPKINQGNLIGLEIPNPNIDKVIQFSSIVDTFYNKKHKNIDQIKALESLRDSLLPKLMSGLVKVRD